MQALRSIFLLLTLLITAATRPSCLDSCPINEAEDAYILKFKRAKCKDEREFSNFLLPLKYTHKCNSCDYGGHGSEHAWLEVTYPEFTTSENIHKDDLQDNEMRIYLSSNCQFYYGKDQMSTKWRSEHFSSRIKKNAASKGLNGKPRYAAIKDLGNGLYFQDFINERKDGYDIYFVKNENKEIGSMFWCDEGFCSTIQGQFTSDMAYHFEYRFRGIEIDHFPNLDEQVQTFVEKLYSQSRQ